ncbi:LysR family transcriptional regulator [Rhizobium sp. NFR03]|uniref:LysR family transcriptional regulator n=1 Tax=Rhizobium sp. NFR03 TaxID=1566263 RepID=UPI0008C12302|nr:LysR family transcriptional regulator [Rhizobium sp. NFR03]SES40788.1 DNA-binding transcriptional regulator, LysR family [Rhizobium sp. NFR03]
MAALPRQLVPSTSALTAFDAVAKLGSFSAAAQGLNLTQGAVSRQVALLEGQLGVRLFERTNKGVVLTAKGEHYAAGVSDIINRIRTLSLETMASDAKGLLKLAILPTFGTRWLMPRMPDFIRRNPGITINFATRIGQFDFRSASIDAAIHVGRPDWPAADCQFLMHETVVPVCSPAFRQQHPVRGPRDLLSAPLIDMASRPGAWQHWFASLGIPVSHRQRMSFEQFSSVAQACIEGLGVALMPTFLIAAEMEAGQLVEAYDWRIQSPSSYYVVRPLDRVDYGPAARFAVWILDQAAQFHRSGEVSKDPAVHTPHR